MQSTSGTRGRRKEAFEESSKGATAENQKNFEKLLVFLNCLMSLILIYYLLIKGMLLNLSMKL